MNRINLKTTQPKQVLDITLDVNDFLAKQSQESGLCYLFLTHTTAALTTADMDPGTDLDTLDYFAKLGPDIKYRHPHDPAHTTDHINSSLIGPSIILPFENKRLVLGQWQKVVLIEFYGPKDREIIASVITAS